MENNKVSNPNLKYQMIVIAEIYNNNAHADVFKKFTPKAMKGIKTLAAELRKRKKTGEIK